MPTYSEVGLDDVSNHLFFTVMDVKRDSVMGKGMIAWFSHNGFTCYEDFLTLGPDDFSPDSPYMEYPNGYRGYLSLPIHLRYKLRALAYIAKNSRSGKARDWSTKDLGRFFNSYPSPIDFLYDAN